MLNTEALEVFPCPRCGKHFDYINALKRHGKTCNANKPRKCRKCLQWFENQLCASKHEVNCFSDSAPLSCQFCSKQFEHLYTLQRHYRATHHLKTSMFKKADFGTLIEYRMPASEERLQAASEHTQNNLRKSPQSVYTIEIESVNDISDDNDPNVQTLVYKIRETTDSTEVETLSECVISDFNTEIYEDEPTDDVIELDNYDDNIKIEYVEEEDYVVGEDCIL